MIDADRSGRDAIGRLLAPRPLEIRIINQPALDINLSSRLPKMRQHSCAMMTCASQLANPAAHDLTERTMDSGTRYNGPLSLPAAKSKFGITTLKDNPFNREGPRAFVEYRDLGLAGATDGRIGAKHIRAIRPFDKETGWHWHDMDGHFVYVLKGWVRFQFEGIADPVTVETGSCISQPGGVPHNVIGQSDDLEIIEINLPACYATIELPPKGP